MDQMDIKTVQDVEALLMKLIKKGCVDEPNFAPTPMTIPMHDAKGFDSLIALEVLTELEEETGLHFEDDIFYVDLKPKKYLAIHDIAVRIWEEIHGGRRFHA